MERVLSLEGAAQGGLKSSSLEVSREGLDVPLRALGWGTMWGSITGWI